jgi:hypothetical protein
MKLIAILTIFALISGPTAALGAAGKLSPAAQRHVTRISHSLTALRKDPGAQLANTQANRALELLLKDRSAAGDEALAALLGHPLGDSTEPECEALARGRRMLPLLLRFDRNPPPIQLPASSVHSRLEIIDQIEAGIRCDGQ